MHQTIVCVGGILALAALGSSAGAQEERKILVLPALDTTTNDIEDHGYLMQSVPAPSDALELKVGTGYTQGFGNVAPGRGLTNVAGAGLGISADIDYRLTHHWSLGVEGQFQTLENEQNSSARGMALNLGGTYHFEPILRGDPWIRLGSGFRSLWENNPTGAQGATVVRFGIEALTAKIGYDVRVSDSVAIAPVIGADLNVFAWGDTPTSSTQALSTAQVGTFIYAGLQGRFDLGGDRGGVPVRQTGVTEMQAPEPTPEPAAPPPVEQPRQVAPSIAVSEEILRACKQDLGSVEKAPKFDFDESDLLPQDFSVLKVIGECFATGPLKGMRMILVGRADPRGTLTYNEALGARRAGSVASYLATVGVDSGNIKQVSRGKLDARGTDEATWAIDRRVDILLGSDTD